MSMNAAVRSTVDRVAEIADWREHRPLLAELHAKAAEEKQAAAREHGDDMHELDLRMELDHATRDPSARVLRHAPLCVNAVADVCLPAA